MAYYEIAFDLGSKNTRAGIAGTDIFYNEPTVVAYSAKGNKYLGAGYAALKAYEKDKQNVVLRYPVSDGTVTDRAGAAAMIKSVASAVIPQSAYEPQIKAAVSVSAGSSADELREIERVFVDAGVYPVTFIESAVAAAEYMFNCFGVTSGGIINIGHKMTEIAAVSGGKTIEGATVYLGGDIINRGIVYLIEDKFHLSVRDEVAEKVKEKCISFNSKDVTTAVAGGIDLSSGLNKEVRVTAKDLYPALSDTMEYIAAAALSLTGGLEDDVLRQVRRNGFFLAGGGARIYGADSYFAEKLCMPVRMWDEPEFAVINGMTRKVIKR